jgi:hypothetical protein
VRFATGRQPLGEPLSARWRPTPRLILISVLLSSSALSKFRNIYHSVRESALLPLGIAASVVAAVVGLTTGLASAAASAPAAVSKPAADSPAAVSKPVAGVPLAARAASHATAARPAWRTGLTNVSSPPKAVLADRAAPVHQNHPQAASQRPDVSVRPYSIYDSVTPWAIPAHQKVATYANGNYAVSPGEVAGRGQVAWIDVSGSDINASALDVEPGNATPSIAANWALDKLRAQPGGVAWIYTMESEWPAVKYAVATTVPTRMWSHIHWWIADPTGVPHLVPGSSATQWYWGPHYDISEANQQGL